MSDALIFLPDFSPDRALLGFDDSFFAELQAIQKTIAREAYARFKARGSQHGFALDDWLSAESAMLTSVPVSIEDVGAKLKITAAVPGFPEKDLRVHVNHGKLRICGKTEENDTDGDHQHHSTRIIRQELTLPVAVDSGHALFTVENGIMTLMLPKAQVIQNQAA